MKRLLAVALCLSGCIRPGEQRTELDAAVGTTEAHGIRLVSEGGLAHVAASTADTFSLWAQAPALRWDVSATEDRGPLRLVVENCMPTADVEWQGDTLPRATSPGTTCDFTLPALRAGEEGVLRVAPPDSDTAARYSFAVMGDIQTGLDTVDDIFRRIAADPDIEFVMGTGDLVEDAEHEEYDLYVEQLAVLPVPLFSTIGNHELENAPERWRDRFGRMSLFFHYRDVAFSFVDSGNASVDPANYDLLRSHLDRAQGRTHVFGTHYPPFDPVGTRAGSFRSRKEAAKLLNLLAEGDVDSTFYGHLHSYYAFVNAGIPAYISGGGGAIPERLDGVGRHYLKVTVYPDVETPTVALVRVD